MSTFRVRIVGIRAIEPIPGADAIKLAVVGDYRSVVRKGRFAPGDLAAYLPESAILPDGLIGELGLTGKLSGPGRNRIKAIRLRGCLSQGILHAMPGEAMEGDDVAGRLGVTKYEPVVPMGMTGEVAGLHGVPVRYDIEDFKAFPGVLRDGEDVVMTEKAHGTFCGIAVVPGIDAPDMFGDDGVVYSKGLGAKGLVFKDVPGNTGNTYVGVAMSLGVHDRIRGIFPGKAVHVLGEIHGAGIQDLSYGKAGHHLAVFDVMVDGTFLDKADMAGAAASMGLATVPVLYSGPFSREAMHAHTDGGTVMGAGAHIREGVVVTPARERRDDAIGRVILKSISGDYLTRKGRTTEFS